ncbi:MAG: GAF domain-containing protein [Chloroflexota bacterium]|nr:MAG: GAF domain-containing protein [Chloroflexota bacterium]
MDRTQASGAPTQTRKHTSRGGNIMITVQCGGTFWSGRTELWRTSCRGHYNCKSRVVVYLLWNERTLSVPRLSLRGKLIASFTLILIPVLVLLMLFYREANEQRIDTVLDSQMRTAQAIAGLVDAHFDEGMVLATALANDPVVHSLDSSQLDPYLERLASNYPQYDVLGVVNVAGDTVGTSMPYPAGAERLNSRDRPFFKQVMSTGKPVMSSVFINRRTFRPTMTAVVPVRDESGSMIGVVTVGTYMDTLADRLQGVALGPEQRILLVDTTGTAAFYTGLPALAEEERNLSDFEPVKAALDDRPTEVRGFVSPLVGDARIGAFTATPKYGWVVGVDIRESVALAPVSTALRNQLLGFGAIAILSLGLAVVLSSVLIKPVRRLIKHALALGNGDLSQRADIKTGDEMEKLGHTFNQMAERLGRTLEERQSLGRVARVLVRELALERVADIVVDEGQRVLGASKVGLFLAEVDREELRLIANRGFSAQSVAEISIVHYADPLLSAVAARTGQPQEIPDIADVDPELADARQIAEREAQRSVLSQPLFAKGRLVGVLTLALSTARRFSEEERELIRAFSDLCAAAIENARLYEELRQTLHLREEFISAAAHELKTPVTTIKGYVQAMNKWAPGGHDAREAVALDVINRQCDRVNVRVQEMLESVRLRRFPPEQRRVRFDLGDLASEVVQRIQATTPLVRVVLERETLAPVDADRERIEDVLASFLENAIRFSPEGEEVGVRVFVRDGKAVVAVRNCGMGIPKERQPHVFEPFYDAVPAGGPGYRGVVALSLYLSKITIELHRGRVWLESEEGKGSTFYFDLPLAGETSLRR